MKYGPLDKPEEQPRIELVDDPVRTVRALYELFKPVARSMADRARTYTHNKESVHTFTDNNAEALYSHAIRLLEGKALNIDGTIIDNHFDHHEPGVGFFLSAMLNTSLDTLVITQPALLGDIGYNLAAGKTLVLGRNARAVEVGYRAEGYVLNWGWTLTMADKATDGIQVSWGECGSAGALASGGMRIVYNHSNMLRCRGGLQSAKSPLTAPQTTQGGLQHRWNPVKGTRKYSSQLWWKCGGIEDAADTLGQPISIYKLSGLVSSSTLYLADSRRLSPGQEHPADLIARCAKKLRELSFIPKLRTAKPEQASKVLSRLKSFDLKKYEESIKSLSEEIDELLP